MNKPKDTSTLKIYLEMKKQQKKKKKMDDEMCAKMEKGMGSHKKMDMED